MCTLYTCVCVCVCIQSLKQRSQSEQKGFLKNLVCDFITFRFYQVGSTGVSMLNMPQKPLCFTAWAMFFYLCQPKWEPDPPSHWLQPERAEFSFAANRRWMLAVAFVSVQAEVLEPRQLAAEQSLLTVQQGRVGMFPLNHIFYWNISIGQCQLTCISIRRPFKTVMQEYLFICTLLFKTTSQSA